MRKQLKPVCVGILPLARVDHPSKALQLVKQLRELNGLVQTSNADEFQEAFVSYAFFPLTQILSVNPIETLHKHPTVLEATLICIVTVLSKDKSQSIPYDTLQQLWFVCILVFGGPLDNSLVDANGKGKGKEKAQSPFEWPETAVTAVLNTLNFVIPRCAADLRKAVKKDVTRRKALPVSVIAHTLTSFLDRLPTSQPETQLQILQGLRKLLDGHLSRQLIVQSLPGYTSSLCKVIVQGTSSKTRSKVIVIVLQHLKSIIVQALSNKSCAAILEMRDALRPKISKLEDLASLGDAVASPQKKQDDAPINLKGKDQVPGSSPTWLNATSHQIHRALQSVMPILLAHDQVEVRLELALFSETLVKDCWQTLQEESIEQLLNVLLCFTQIDWVEVSSAARQVLSAILADRTRSATSSESCSTLASRLIVRSTASSLLRLPQSILSHGDNPAGLLQTLNLLRGGLQTLSVGEAPGRSALAEFVERWSWSLLRSLEFAEIPSLPTDGSSDLRQAWLKPASKLLAFGADESGVDATPHRFPKLEFKHVRNPDVAKQLALALGDLANMARSSKGVPHTLLLEHFLGIATSRLSPSLQSSAWWTLSCLIGGDMPSHSLSNSNAKFLHHLCRTAISELAILSAELDDTPATSDTAPRSSLVPVEHRKGLGEITMYGESLGAASAQAQIDQARRRRLAQHIVRKCTILRTLAQAANVLGIAFAPHLRDGLYIVLTKMSASEHPLIREHGEIALSSIAYACAYASNQNLVLTNVDYIINAASQRLLPTRLDPMAPEVLIVAIRLAGHPIIPYIQDVVDDIFDALDNFHGYDMLLTRLLAVLDALLKSLAEAAAEAHDEPRLADRPTPLYKPPDPSQDIQSFLDWHHLRYQDRTAAEEERWQNAKVEPPQQPWTSETPTEDKEQVAEEEEPLATKSQTICTSITSKATYFLTHSSAFIRARMLSLMASAVPILGPNRGQDLLPVMNKAWPLVLNRLNIAEPLFVIAEAANLVEQLALHVGDFMCRRILDEAWPLFVHLIEDREAKEADSALKSTAVPYTVSNRLFLAILNTMKRVVESVPLRDGAEWPIAMRLRPFFSMSADHKIQSAAVRAFKALAIHKPEVVWLITQGMLGTEMYPQCLELDKQIARSHLTCIFESD